MPIYPGAPAYFRLVEWRAFSRIEMHLESARDQRVRIADAKLEIHFKQGERIHTENSYKFTDATIGVLLRDGGFEAEQTWTDNAGGFP